jgi:hypothetical protein
MAEPQQSPNPTNPNPAPNPSPAGGGRNGGGTPFIATLPGVRDEFKSLPNFKDYKDINGLLSSHIALEKKLGTAINVPGPDATDEERSAFFNKIGRPETPDKYTFNAKEIVEKTLGKDFPVNEPFLNMARAAFHQHGLNDTQGKALVEMFVGAQKAELDAIQAGIDKDVGELKQEWGHAFDSKVALATRAVETLAADCPRLAKWFEDPRNGSNPAMIELMAYLGTVMGEDKAIDGQQKLTPNDETSIKDEINRMNNDPNHPDYKALHDGDHPMHKKAVEKKMALYEQLHPGKEEIVG